MKKQIKKIIRDSESAVGAVGEIMRTISCVIEQESDCVECGELREKMLNIARGLTQLYDNTLVADQVTDPWAAYFRACNLYTGIFTKLDKVEEPEDHSYSPRTVREGADERADS